MGECVWEGVTLKGCHARVERRKKADTGDAADADRLGAALALAVKKTPKAKMKRTKKIRSRLTDRQIAECALEMIKTEQKRRNIPEHYRVWLAQRERALTEKLK